MKTIHLLHFLILCVYLHAGAANANISTEVICTHAPSQNIEVFGAGTISATVSREIFLLENGLKHVQHSSGRKILINAAGRYIKGTLSRPVPGPVILVVGALVAGSLVTVELACTPINHPDKVEQYSSAAKNTLDSLFEMAHSYKSITEDKFYELMGETWHERAIRKTKRAFGAA
jgi:hypothetical protein